MVHCFVPSCRLHRASAPEVSFHEFPCEDSLRKQWIEHIVALGGLVTDGNEQYLPEPADRDVVCSRHFIPQDFKEGKKRRILKKGAIPTIFIPSCPEDMVPKSKFNVERTSNTSASKSGHDQSSTDAPPSPPTSTTSTPKRTARKSGRTAQKLKVRPERDLFEVVKLLKEDCLKGNNRARFLVEQLQAYKNPHHSWSDTTVKLCRLFYGRSARAYKYATSNFLTLPSRSTLLREKPVSNANYELSFLAEICSNTKDNIVELEISNDDTASNQTL